MMNTTETSSRGSFRCQLVRLKGGVIRLEATCSPAIPCQWMQLYPPHALEEARQAAAYYCATAHLVTYAELLRLRENGLLPAA